MKKIVGLVGLLLLSCGIPFETRHKTSEVSSYEHTNASDLKEEYYKKYQETKAKIKPNTIKVQCEISESCIESWVEASEQIILPGNPKVIEGYIADNEKSLHIAQSILSDEYLDKNNIVLSVRSMIFKEIIKLAYSHLKQQYPQSTFELAVVEHEAIASILKNEKLQSSHRRAPSFQVILRKKGQGKVESYIVNPAVVYNKRTIGEFAQIFDEQVYPELSKLFINSSSQEVQKKFEEYQKGEFLEYSSYFIIEDLLPTVLKSDLNVDTKIKFMEHFALSFDSNLKQGEKLNHLIHKVAPGSLNQENLFALIEMPADEIQKDKYLSHINVIAVDNNEKNKNITVKHHNELVWPKFNKYFLAFGSETERRVWKKAVDEHDVQSEVAASMKMSPVGLNDDGFEFSEEQMSVIKPITDQIIKSSRKSIEQSITKKETLATEGVFPIFIASLPLVFITENGKIIDLPLFRIKSRSGQVFFVDNLGSYYPSFSSWRRNNQLPKGTISYFKNGRISKDEKGNPGIITESTENLGEKIRASTDTISFVGTVVVAAGTVALFPPLGVPVAAKALIGGVVGKGGAALLAYSSITSAQDVHKRVYHRRNLSIMDPMARSEYINLVTSITGISVIGFRVLTAVNRSATVAQKLAYLTVFDNILDVVAFGDSAYHLAFTDLTPGQRLSLAFQSLFWLSRTAYSAHNAGGFKKLYSVESVKQMYLSESQLLSQNLRTGRAQKPLTVAQRVERIKKAINSIDSESIVNEKGQINFTADSAFSEIRTKFKDYTRFLNLKKVFRMSPTELEYLDFSKMYNTLLPQYDFADATNIVRSAKVTIDGEIYDVIAVKADYMHRDSSGKIIQVNDSPNYRDQFGRTLYATYLKILPKGVTVSDLPSNWKEQLVSYASKLGANIYDGEAEFLDNFKKSALLENPDNPRMESNTDYLNYYEKVTSELGQYVQAFDDLKIFYEHVNDTFVINVRNSD